MRNISKKRYWIPLCLSLIVSPVLAQSVIDIQPLVNLEIDIPFQFTVVNRTFPAGRYIIQQSNEDASVLDLISIDRGPELQLFSESETTPRPSNSTYVDFGVSENRHYLSSISTLGSDLELLIPTKPIGLVRTPHAWRAEVAVSGTERTAAAR